MTVELESRHWIVIESIFRMRLWCWSQSKPKIRDTSMLAEVRETGLSRCALNQSVICNCWWETEEVLRGIPPACVVALVRKRTRRWRWSLMSFRIGLRSLAVSTRACTSYPTTTTTSYCRRAGFLSFAWRWPKPDSFTVATCALATLGLALFCCFALRDLFPHCASLWVFLSQ